MNHTSTDSVMIFAALTSVLVLGACSAWSDGWFLPLSEKAKSVYAPEVTHFFSFYDHLGVWALLVLNIFLALAMAMGWRQWNLLAFAGVFVVMLVASVYMMDAWAQGDNESTKRVLSAFSRDGLLTVSGVLLAVSGAIAYTITVMYFLTPGPAVQNRFALIFAIVLTLYLPAGLLQPPKHVWGEIHSAAWIQTIGGIFVVWVLFAIRYVLASA